MIFDYELIFYILVALIVSIIDLSKEEIPDTIMLPAIFILAIYQYYDNSFDLNSIIAVAFVFVIFLIPILLNMQFGGGDIRFGIFSAILLSFPDVAIFLLLSGIIHTLFLISIEKGRAGFAPSMSISAIATYIFADNIWQFFGTLKLLL